MFNALMQSRPGRRSLRRSLPSTLFSIGLHAALAYAAVKGTIAPAPEPEPRQIQVDISYHGPEQRVLAAPPPLPRIPVLVVPREIPTAIPPIDSEAVFDPHEFPGVGTDRGTPGRQIPLSVSPADVFISAVVDQPPIALSFPQPQYPGFLLAARVSGTVVLEAIIDTSGEAEAQSIRVISSTNRAFEAPARDAMRRALFRPGRIRGTPVRVLVHLPVRFVVPGREP